MKTSEALEIVTDICREFIDGLLNGSSDNEKEIAEIKQALETLAQSERVPCPDCGSDHMQTETIKTDEFEYGLIGTVCAQVPVITCQTCGFMWSDDRGEVARTEATIAALSKEVMRLRQSEPTQSEPGAQSELEAP